MKNKKHIVTGILAHVDAGKTTLSEAILYTAGNLRKIGRVDNGDAFLDTYELERSRGITIFSKQAEVSMNEMDLTLLDTPGHVDFSAEMERTLQVLDYAVLVISGADGVQGHTLTLWSLLERYKIPTFLFINKMDQDGTQKDQLLKELQERLSSGCINFGEKGSDEFYEMIAMEDEALLDHYLESGEITESKIREMITERKIFPCFFGSALKLQGVNEFLSNLAFYTEEREYPEEFGARIFKITRDENGNRMFMDNDGNTNHEASRKYILSLREQELKNAKTMQAIDRYVAEHAETPAEAFTELTGNIFPKRDLQNQLARIRTNKKLQNHQRTW